MKVLNEPISNNTFNMKLWTLGCYCCCNCPVEQILRTLYETVKSFVLKVLLFLSNWFVEHFIVLLLCRTDIEYSRSTLLETVNSFEKVIFIRQWRNTKGRKELQKGGSNLRFKNYGFIKFIFYLKLTKTYNEIFVYNKIAIL